MHWYYLTFKTPFYVLKSDYHFSATISHSQFLLLDFSLLYSTECTPLYFPVFFFFSAFFDVTPYLKCYSWAVKECQRYGEKWTKKWAHEPTLIRVSAEIPEIMAHHATPVNSDLYPSWDRFLQDFLKRG